MTRKQALQYAGVVAGCLAIGVTAGWTALGDQIDNDAHDFLFRLHAGASPAAECVLVGIDERTWATMGGVGRLRRTVAEALEIALPADPVVVVIDLLLAGQGEYPEDDARLEAALGRSRSVVLAASLTSRGWEEPYEPFARRAAAIGHVQADADPHDNVVRRVPLEKAHGRTRRWALALEAWRLSRGADIEESPESLRAGPLEIPAAREQARSMLIRFRLRGDGEFTLTHISIEDLKNQRDLAQKLTGKVVFIGFTAQAQDRHWTPVSSGQTMPGVEIHANAYETLAGGRFLRPASDSAGLTFCMLLAVSAAATFYFLGGWPAYLAGAVVLAAGHFVPYTLFARDIVFPVTGPVASAW
ncbi:MAG: CHASE2 domain-containing protein, partial [Bryobacteraceae bacterium]